MYYLIFSYFSHKIFAGKILKVFITNTTRLFSIETITEFMQVFWILFQEVISNGTSILVYYV